MSHRHPNLAKVFRLAGGDRLLRRVPAWGGVVALAYHRIGNSSGSPFDHGLWSASPEGFDAQVTFLKGHCDVIGLADLKDAVSTGRGRYALITFDDGYRDNYEVAFPILRRHNVPGVFFVATGFIDRPRLAWWDEIAWMVRTSTRRSIPAGKWLASDVEMDEPIRERAVRSLLRKYKVLNGDETDAYLDYVAEATGSERYAGESHRSMWMTWDMLREMKGAGMWVGGHTVNHPVLSRLPAERQRDEVGGCRRRIEQELGGKVSWLSYPVGGRTAFNDDTRGALRAEGFEVAFSYYGGYGRFDRNWDWYDVPRVGVETDVCDGEFRAVVTLPQMFARPAD